MNLLNRLSIQSKLIMLLTAVSIGSMLVVCFVTYSTGCESLYQDRFRQLDGLRRVRAGEIETRFRFNRDQVLSMSDAEGMVKAVKSFRAAYDQLAQKSLAPEQDARLREYYEKTFIPRLAENTEGTPVAEAHLPRTPAGRYLQYHYLAANPHPYLKGSLLDRAEDDSEYSQVHGQLHPRYRRFAQRFNYEDMLLVTPDTGEVVYAAEKTVALGTSLLTGPFAQSNLGQLVRSLQTIRDRGELRIVDFELSRPYLGAPTAFLGSPVFDGQAVIGFFIVKVPATRLDRVLTGDGQWKRDGLGRTGEVYLVGPDQLMRSSSRAMKEDQENYYRDLKKARCSDGVIERIRRHGTPILRQPARTAATDRALQGEEGADVLRDYRGRQVFTSYAPIDLDGLRWVIVAQVDADEAYESLYRFGRLVLFWGAAVALVVTLLALASAILFVRPIHRLMAAAEQVTRGETGVEVHLGRHDEFGALARAFNQMSRTLKEQDGVIQSKARENEGLVLSILPGSAAVRMRGGETQIAESHPDVTVLFADLVGFPELAESLPAEEAVGLLNNLVVAMDETAERHGVEKFRTSGTSYLAVCGLSAPRPDHVARMLEFAREALRIVRRLNQDRGTDLRLQVGINCGPVHGGVIGQNRFQYHLWGDTVMVARAIRRGGTPNTIQVTQAVYDRLRDQYEFGAAVEVEVAEQRRLSVRSVQAA